MHFNTSCVSSLQVPQNPLAQGLVYFSEAFESAPKAQTCVKHSANNAKQLEQGII